MRRQLLVAQPLQTRAGWDRWLVGDPGDWLPHERAAGPGRWRLQLRVGEWVQRPVEVAVGAPLRHGDSLARSMVWTPLTIDADPVEARRVLPAFEGELLLLGAEASATLVVAGDVTLPLGWLGGALDAAVLAKVGDGAVSDLLRRIVRRHAHAAEGQAPRGTHQRSVAPRG